MWRGDAKPGEWFGWPAVTLTQVEADDWGEPEFPSGLVIRCHALRGVPLRDWSVDDLRCMIGQRISLPTLLPLALDLLGDDPFAGEWPGNLLEHVLRVEPAFWRDHVGLWQRTEAVVAEVEQFAEQLRVELLPAAGRFRAAWQSP